MKYKDHQQGFTLIEVVIAVLLLTVAIMGAVSVTTSVIKSNSFSQTLTTATTLAKDKMEELKAAPYTDLTQAASMWAGTDYAAANGAIQASSAGSYFTRSWTAPTVSSAPTVPTAPTAKTITVTVTWPTNRTVELKTIRASD